MLCIEWVSHTVSHQQLLMEKATILHNNHHLLLALLASSAGIELISLSVRVTSAKFQQSVGGTETGTHRTYISVTCFYFSSRKFLFLLSKNMIFWFLFLLSKVEIRISNFSFYSWIYFFDSRQCLVLSSLESEEYEKFEKRPFVIAHDKH